MVRGFSCRKGGRYVQYSLIWIQGNLHRTAIKGVKQLTTQTFISPPFKKGKHHNLPHDAQLRTGLGMSSLVFRANCSFFDKKECIALFHFLKEWINLFKRVMRAIHSHRLFKRARRAMNLKEQRICFHPQLIWFREKNERFALKKRESLFHKERITLVFEKWKEWSTHFALVDL